MFQRDQWGLVSPLPWGLSEQGGTAATSEALLSLFMQMGLIPREPALKPLSTGLVKFPNCFSACVSSAWAHEPRAFLYGFDSVFLRNGMVSAPHVLQRSRALMSSKCTQLLTSVPHASTLLNTSSQTPQLHHLVEYQGLASAPGPPHYFDVTLRWHCHLCCCRNSHGDKWWNHPWRHQLAGTRCDYSLSFSCGFWCNFRQGKQNWLWSEDLCFLNSSPTPSSSAPGTPEPGRPHRLSLIPPLCEICQRGWWCVTPLPASGATSTSRCHVTSVCDSEIR